MFLYNLRIFTALDSPPDRFPRLFHLALPQCIGLILGPIFFPAAPVRERVMLLQVVSQEIRTFLRPYGVGMAAIIRKVLLEDNTDPLIIIIHIQKRISVRIHDLFHIIEHLLLFQRLSVGRHDEQRFLPGLPQKVQQVFQIRFLFRRNRSRLPLSPAESGIGCGPTSSLKAYPFRGLALR